MFQIGDNLKTALDQYCGKHNVSRASVIRTAIAKYIEFDLANEVRPDRKRLYENTEARVAAQRERNREQRAAMRQLLEAVRRGDKLEELKHLARTLGLDPEAL
jgi:hypothetical protein